MRASSYPSQVLSKQPSLHILITVHFLKDCPRTLGRLPKSPFYQHLKVGNRLVNTLSNHPSKFNQDESSLTHLPPSLPLSCTAHTLYPSHMLYLTYALVLLDCFSHLICCQHPAMLTSCSLKTFCVSREEKVGNAGGEHCSPPAPNSSSAPCSPLALLTSYSLFTFCSLLTSCSLLTFCSFYSHPAHCSPLPLPILTSLPYHFFLPPMMLAR